MDLLGDSLSFLLTDLSGFSDRATRHQDCEHSEDKHPDPSTDRRCMSSPMSGYSATSFRHPRAHQNAQSRLPLPPRRRRSYPPGYAPLTHLDFTFSYADDRPSRLRASRHSWRRNELNLPCSHWCAAPFVCFDATISSFMYLSDLPPWRAGASKLPTAPIKYRESTRRRRPPARRNFDAG